MLIQFETWKGATVANEPRDVSCVIPQTNEPPGVTIGLRCGREFIMRGTFSEVLERLNRHKARAIEVAVNGP
jgi:uncharacterized protein YlzI (FlbEa/FlbD family)